MGLWNLRYVNKLVPPRDNEPVSKLASGRRPGLRKNLVGSGEASDRPQQVFAVT